MISPPADIDEYIIWAAKQARVPAAIVRSVAWHESRFNPEAVSPKGAKGIMQLMPASIEQYVVSDPFDPEQSLRVGSEILRKLKERHGSWESALAAYNWGTGNVSKHPARSSWPQSVRNYVDRIMSDAGLVKPNTVSLFLAGFPVALLLLRRFYGH
jgi:soluble lytic murein transglycosylase-like protein